MRRAFRIQSIPRPRALHFPKHVHTPSVPPVIHLKTTERFGRGVYASRDLRAGEIVLREPPFVAVAKSGFLENSCQYCFKELELESGHTSEHVTKFSENYAEQFCSESCRDQAWDQFNQHLSHVPAYPAVLSHFRALGTLFPIAITKILAIILIDRARNGDTTRLLSRLSELQHAEVDPWHYPKEWREAIEWVETGTGIGKGGISSSLYARLFTTLNLNSFGVAFNTLSSPSPRVPCTAVYLLASCFNHACPPTHTAEATWPEGTNEITVQMRRDAAKGEQIFISYVDEDKVEGWGPGGRKAWLWEQYGIRCECWGCAV